MKDFVAINFGTANGRRSSVCSVGIVILRNGEPVDSSYSLIHPFPNYYTYWTTEVHGLTEKDTADAPTFHEVWQQIEDKIAGLPFGAHNKAFDESGLRVVFDEYEMEYPEYEFYCTLIASHRCPNLDLPNHRLHTTTAACGFNPENHHHALADAEACAAIALKLL